MKHEEIIRACVRYEPNTGDLYWVESSVMNSGWNAIWPGKRAGSISPDGYKKVKIKGKCFQQHRVAWLLCFGDWPHAEIDHINGDRSDNRIQNLRDVPHHENMKNCGPRVRGSSRFMGVHWCESASRWRVIIRIQGKPTYFGEFVDEREAGRVAASAYRSVGIHTGMARERNLRRKIRSAKSLAEDAICESEDTEFFEGVDRNALRGIVQLAELALASVPGVVPHPINSPKE